MLVCSSFCLLHPSLLIHFISNYFSSVFCLQSESASELVILFDKIRRSNELNRHYFQTRQVPIEQMWNEFQMQITHKQDQTTQFATFITNFYDEIIYLIDKEVRTHNCLLLH
jgi:hypothetical protein